MESGRAFREVLVVTLANKGAALGVLGSYQAALAVFDDIERRFGADADSSIRSLLDMVRESKDVVVENRDRAAKR